MGMLEEWRWTGRQYLSVELAEALLGHSFDGPEDGRYIAIWYGFSQSSHTLSET